MEAFCQTFVGVLGHSATPKSYQVKPLRQGDKAVDGVLLCIPRPGNEIQILHCFRIHNAVHLQNRIQMLPRPAIAGHQAQVEHILFIHELLARGDHIGLGHQQAHKQGRTKGNDHHDGYVSAHGFDDRLAQILAHGVSLHYHSISAMS